MLARMFKVLHKDEKGFTLIELMIVILIIGILVAIAVPVFNAARRNAQRRTCQANLRTTNGAVQQYHADNDPVAAVTDIDTLIPTYIKKEPFCPAEDSTPPDEYSMTDEQAICPMYSATAGDPGFGHTF